MSEFILISRDTVSQDFAITYGVLSFSAAIANKLYKVMFTDYPDIVGITDLQSMLRISRHAA